METWEKSPQSKQAHPPYWVHEMVHPHNGGYS